MNTISISRALGCAYAACAVVAGLTGGQGTANADDPDAPIMAEQTGDLGDIVVDAHGMTVYAFEGDIADTSGCQGQCLKNWPIVAAPETVPASVTGVEGQLGVFVRPGGARQLTLDFHPLYTFIQDTTSGQHNGVGKNLGGFRWGVVLADGEPRY